MEKDLFSKIPSFSVILIMFVLSTIGFGVIPLLNIQYTPSFHGQEISVNYAWPDASARVVESEVTSKIEGVVAAVRGVNHINSVSYKNGGSVSVSLKKNTDMDAVRFEIASLIRQIYPKLPEGVTYPTLSVSTANEQAAPVLIYTLNADLPTQQIEQYAQDNIVKEIALIKGINSVRISGATPFYLDISFDPAKLQNYGLSIGELQKGINAGLEHNDVVGNVTRTDSKGSPYEISVVLGNRDDQIDFGNIPLKNVGGRIVRLADVAEVAYKEQLPSYYFRINGLNTVNLTVTPEKYVNTLELTDKVKVRMTQLEQTFPDSFSSTVSYDSSTYVKKELNKILLRTVLSLVILLLFVFAVSRSLRYLLVITVTLLANVLIAFIFYHLLNLEIHLYSLAGITVSLGIIIDTSIIMIDHYGYYHDRKAFIAILCAVLTTIGSLAIVFFLPEQTKANLADFAAVMIVNLSVSIVIALIFVPAMIDKLPIVRKKRKYPRRRMRRLLRFNRAYARYIRFGKHYKWAFILLIVLGFGLPVQLLPEKIKTGENEQPSFWVETYNKTLGSDWYQEKMKPVADKTLGGSLRLFLRNIKGGNYYREPQRQTLYINASMPEGCTVQQLNDIMRMMENYLSQFEEIDMFKTYIYGYDNGRIEVTFREQAEKSGFPSRLKNEVITQAINYGGANWSVFGIDENSFNNNLVTGYKSSRITLTGYNYDELYKYAAELAARLSKNKRVNDPGIYGRVEWNNTLSRNEFYIDFHQDRIALYGIDPWSLYGALQEKLYNQWLTSYYDGKSLVNVVLNSSQREQFDQWHLANEYLGIGEQNVRFSELGNIAKRRTGNDIYKSDQQYMLIVAFDFVGPYELAQKVIQREADHMNEHILPIGYKAEIDSFYWGGREQNKQYWLIVLVIVIIYFCCAILFESLSQPLVILSLIPVSFIGVFLIFALTGYSFDQGGFAAFVLLCGTVVNAGIYLINQYNLTCKDRPRSMRNYLKAYNHKIIPILLTILASVLGLLPFLYDGESEVFWFAFAIGTMGGLLFSVIALIFILPLFIPVKNRKKRTATPVFISE